MVNKIATIITFFSILIFFGFSSSIYSDEKAKLKGTIISSEINNPLYNATIILRKATDSSIVSGAISDKKGNFTISANEGIYILEVKFIGYETKFVNNIKLIKSQTTNLEPIKLELLDIIQDEIIVQEEKETVIFGIDSKIFNVTKDIAVGENNVLDILRKIPSVSVDLEDNVTMNGRSPKILIDGKESQLASKEMLKVLSSELVESVELITNPSAKYESEGVTGIIDIKLKKDTDNGFNAMISANMGNDIDFKYQKNYSTNFYSNYKYKKFNIFSNINYGK